jgi:hypothetical protein
MDAHFGRLGSDQKQTVIARYKEVQTNLPNKSYTCEKSRRRLRKVIKLSTFARRRVAPETRSHCSRTSVKRSVHPLRFSCTKRCTTPGVVTTSTEEPNTPRATRRITPTPTKISLSLCRPASKRPISANANRRRLQRKFSSR